MHFSENISLKPYNTFGIDCAARYFAAFATIDDLGELLAEARRDRLLVLGGGSNILLTGDFDGWVLKNELKGISLVSEDADHYYVRAAAGENWHRFVLHCIDHGYAGIENLSLIPGNTGASPMQNIGAYGVEIRDVFHELEAFDIEEGKVRRFGLADCAFGYRESVFKKELKGRFVILNVTFRLNKVPVFNTSYGAISQELDRMKVTELSIRAVSQAVINIRSSKLPDPAVTGNAGSFFKNPVVPETQFEQLQAQYPAIPGYPAGAGYKKIAAGWLIEQCGWKGFRQGDAGCYEKQALVLVNYGHATGSEIFGLSEKIIGSVRDKFGVVIEREVNII